jgi:hypothetical protein
MCSIMRNILVKPNRFRTGQNYSWRMKSENCSNGEKQNGCRQGVNFGLTFHFILFLRVWRIFKILK